MVMKEPWRGDGLTLIFVIQCYLVCNSLGIITDTDQKPVY